MVRPERRTRGDVLAAAAIVLVVVLVAAVLWWTSDARATISRPAATAAPTVAAARAVPDSVRQLWSAPSSRTTGPVVVGSTVIAGEGHELVGRDPKTGQQRWSFARDRDLCGVTWVYDLAVGVYPDDRGCGQVSTVTARTGQRGPTRTGFADKLVTLSTDGTTVLAAGRTRVEMWRSDMVRTLAWGDIDAALNPPLPPTPPCQFLSAAASSSGVAILQVCPDSPDVKLKLLAVSKEDVAPDQKYARPVDVAPDSGAKVLAMSDLRSAVYLPTPQPRVVVFDDAGQETSSTLLPTPATRNAVVSHAGGVVTFWTGDSVMVLDATTLATRYIVAPGGAVPLGPGTVMADKLLIPFTNGIGVYAPAKGTYERTIPVDRGSAAGPVVPTVIGTTVVEQRGDTVVALG